MKNKEIKFLAERLAADWAYYKYGPDNNNLFWWTCDSCDRWDGNPLTVAARAEQLLREEKELFVNSFNETLKKCVSDIAADILGQWEAEEAHKVWGQEWAAHVDIGCLARHAKAEADNFRPMTAEEISAEVLPKLRHWAEAYAVDLGL